MAVEQQTNTRSFVKGLTWRFAATLTTIAVSFVLTGAFDTALKIGPLDFVIKLGVFYLHERLWLTTYFQSLEKKRLLKMALWKLVAVSMTTATTVAVTGDFKLALKLGPADFFLKLFLFYTHELIWDSITFGRTIDDTKKE